ncbi:flagellar basal body rod modification protein [Legionella birminghamensis]|uniref:Basal-body rod modification protein FlgD n=1 Tax=Legionella birminghamensis TaxID=28083 RepID=A0A378I6Z5_9GAMM|nr:flagellar hook capping FlgD N-terminal domain-containing protein [Legionella birminghamensis]KTC68310.1 flagellar basal body rod modification protein [Legionella birminghamensis]STX30977.1 flagellar basal-body rod modification protein FlgD [Legionella birminghamensis]
MSSPIQPAEENNISQTDYLKLFMQELTYQDPLKPIDNREFMAQMAQFSSLQEARNTNENLVKLLGMTSSTQSLMLLQKSVKLRNSNQLGRVIDIEFPDGSPPLLNISINGSYIKKTLLDISEVS